MLHTMFIGRADVVDLHAVGRGGGDSGNYLLHLGVGRVVIADVKPEQTLWSRHV